MGGSIFNRAIRSWYMGVSGSYRFLAMVPKPPNKIESITSQDASRPSDFSPDGNRIVTGGENITIWDTVTGNQMMRINHAGGCTSFSPSGEHIISTDSRTDANGIKVWDAITGKELLTLAGHEDTIWSMSYSPDGKRIVSGGQDKTIRIWDAATGAEVMTLRGHGDWPEEPNPSYAVMRLYRSFWQCQGGFCAKVFTTFASPRQFGAAVAARSGPIGSAILSELHQVLLHIADARFWLFDHRLSGWAKPHHRF